MPAGVEQLGEPGAGGRVVDQDGERDLGGDLGFLGARRRRRPRRGRCGRSRRGPCRAPSSLKERSDSSSSAWSGMMFGAVPARSAPTVRTAVSLAASSRDTTPCSRSTVAAAIRMGSTVVSGRDPWPPWPYSTTRSASAAAIAAPPCTASTPAGRGMTCWPRTMSGTGNRSYRPSSIMARAPLPASSAGWNTSSSVPRQASRAAASSAAAPSRQVTCMSWPQACITGTSAPPESCALPGARVRQAGLLKHREPVHVGAQQHGRARPRWHSTPTTPVPPTPVVTW